MLCSQNYDRTPAAFEFQAKYSQFAWEELAKIQQGDNNFLKVQAMLSISTCCIVFRWIDYARQYVQKTCSIIDSTRLRFIPTYGQPPEYSEEVRHKSTALSQAIYFENYLFLARGGPEPKLTARIEREYRHELQVGNSVLTSLRISLPPIIANVSRIVQDLSVDNEDAGDFVS